MKALYESILDDIDVQMANGEDAVVNELINSPNSKLNIVFDLERRDIGDKRKKKYNDGKLYIPYSYLQNKGKLEPLSKTLDIKVDELIVSGGFNIRVYGSGLSGDNYVNKITCGSGISIQAYSLKNIDINLCKKRWDSKIIPLLPSKIIGTWFDGINHFENVNYETDWCSTINFHIDIIPAMKNCTFNGCNRIRIYSPFLFDGDVADTIHDKWMVPIYEYKYGENTVKIKNFKKLHAIINNPKKYGTGPIFKGLFKDNIKASDVIPWINDLSDLNHVKICNNSMAIHLVKSLTSDLGFNKYQIEATTVDGWNIILTRD